MAKVELFIWFISVYRCLTETNILPKYFKISLRIIMVLLVYILGMGKEKVIKFQDSVVKKVHWLQIIKH